MSDELVVVHKSKLTTIGNSIRSRFGVSGELTLDEMAETVMPSFPSEYQRVDYIESSGTQYITVDFAPTSNDELDIDVAFTENVADGNYGVYGSIYTNVSPSYMERFTIAYYRGKWQYAVGENAYETSVAADNNRHKFSLDAKNGVFKVDNTEIEMQTTAISGGTNTVALFGRKMKYGANTPYISDITPSKLYSAQLKKNGTIKYNLIPCYRKSDNEIGMYDIINGQFYTNAGTGTFTKGADV